MGQPSSGVHLLVRALGNVQQDPQHLVCFTKGQDGQALRGVSAGAKSAPVSSKTSSRQASSSCCSDARLPLVARHDDEPRTLGSSQRAESTEPEELVSL
jgi:hypothetical protein